MEEEGLKLANDIIRRLEANVPAEITTAQMRNNINKAWMDAHYQSYKSLFMRGFAQSFMIDGETPSPHLEDSEQKKVIERVRNSVISKPPYAFITINPYATITLDQFVKYVNKFMKRKFIDAYYYVYEVRKEDLSGLHCHMLIKYNCKPYDLKRNLQSTFKHVCDESNPHVLNIKYIEEDIIQSKISYMQGNKKDAKKEGVMATKVYRVENALSDFYESTPPFPCRGAEYLLPPSDDLEQGFQH